MKNVLFALIGVVVSVAGYFGYQMYIQGDYKEGVYFGSYEYESHGANYVTTAVLTVDSTGNIISCFVDSTYSKDDVYTTKQTLGEEYGMLASSGIEKEWNEQADAFSDKVVAEQGLDWVKWSEEDETVLDVDSISGVTVSADAMYTAVESALELAK